jgi:hypothetical protein
VNIEEIIQKANNFVKKVKTLDKMVDFLNDELAPKIFKDNTEKIFALNKKIIDELIHRL